ncbi:MAG: cell envelope protein SmpA [Proteobacteria bacterium]|nr:MAG: cell envelope protein SmpA [Pseudomonadota bacterium]
MTPSRQNPFSPLARSLPVHTLFFWLLLTATLFIQACSFPGVYKINVQQGTIVEQADLDKLKTGMTRRQVHFVLGTPSLIDTFDSQSEIYAYTFQKAGGEIHRQTVAIHYDENNRLSHYTADLLEHTPAY